MNDDILDALSRHLSSRRITLRLATTALAGSLFAVRSPGARARCHRAGSRCEDKHDCCGGARCKHGRCKCRPGLVKCDGVSPCVNLSSDAQHCGTCSQACASSLACSNGVCCKPGETGCNGVCCSSSTSCLPKGVPGEDVCCSPEFVFVRCASEFLGLVDGHYVCVAPIDTSDRYSQICCPQESLCGDFCCEPAVEGDTPVCDQSTLRCSGVADSSPPYVRAGGRGPN